MQIDANTHTQSRKMQKEKADKLFLLFLVPILSLKQDSFCTRP